MKKSIIAAIIVFLILEFSVLLNLLLFREVSYYNFRFINTVLNVISLTRVIFPLMLLTMGLLHHKGKSVMYVHIILIGYGFLTSIVSVSQGAYMFMFIPYGSFLSVMGIIFIIHNIIWFSISTYAFVQLIGYLKIEPDTFVKVTFTILVITMFLGLPIITHINRFLFSNYMPNIALIKVRSWINILIGIILPFLYAYTVYIVVDRHEVAQYQRLNR